MTHLEVRGVTPEELISELQAHLTPQVQENKYAFQIGLKDLDFDVDEEKLRVAGLTAPFPNFNQAEQALKIGAIKPTLFIEQDGTQHQVLAFDHKPIGYSGFMDCVTHSLAITDLGLFEVGRYSAVDLHHFQKFWGWFLHRRLATSDQVESWREEMQETPEQLLTTVFSALTGSSTNIHS